MFDLALLFHLYHKFTGEYPIIEFSNKGFYSPTYMGWEYDVNPVNISPVFEHKIEYTPPDSPSPVSTGMVVMTPNPAEEISKIIKKAYKEELWFRKCMYGGFEE